MSIKRILLFLALIGFLTYLPSLNNQLFWDDEQFIYKNQYVKTFDLKHIFNSSTTAGAGIDSNYFRPITSLSFAWDYQWWGQNPIGFHLTNTLLHLGVGLMIFLLMNKLGLSKKFSFVLAVFFLVHPIQTEAVTYANSRGDSLYAFFVLAGLLLFRQSFEPKNLQIKIYDKKFSLTAKLSLCLTAGSYVLAILSKEIAIVMLPLVGLVLAKIIFVDDKNKFKNLADFSKKIWQKYQPQLLLFLAMILLASGYLFLRSNYWNFVDSFNFYQGEETSSYSGSLLIRLLTFNRSLYQYFLLLLLPYPLHMERDAILVTTFNNPWLWLSISFVFAIVAVAVWEWQRARSAWWLFGWAWFFCTMLPVTGIVPINGLFYEHWLYLPMVGFFLALGVLLKLVRGFFVNAENAMTGIVDRAVNLSIFAVAAIWIVLTLRQNYIWADAVRFYEYTISHSQSSRLFNNLAMAYAEKGQNDKALENYLLALKISNQYPQVYHNIGNLYLSQGETSEAEKYYLQAIELNPGFYYSYPPLINIYLNNQEKEKLNALLERARAAGIDVPENLEK